MKQGVKKIPVHFEVIEETRCPFYRVGERLILSEKALGCPGKKETCLILVREMTQLLFKILAGERERLFAGEAVFTCSGCTGLIKFVPVAAPLENPGPEGKTEPVLGDGQQRLLERIRPFPLIQILPEDERRALVTCMQQESVREGKVLIRQGDSNRFVYMILSGQMLVMDGPVVMASLGPGELCGEMSYLGEEVATATVTALADSEVAAVASVDFSGLLDRLPVVQNFMARLLARRLRRVNRVRAEEFSACMQGRLKDMAPAELLQIFHMNSKTGVLALELPHGPGKVSFREGCIINAHYQGHANEEAIFAMLGEHEGTYRFTLGLSPQEMKAAEIGDFMKLLMEGIKRVDDVREAKQDSRRV